MRENYRKVICTGCTNRLFDVRVTEIDAKPPVDCFIMIKCGRCREVMLVNLKDRTVIKEERQSAV